MFSQKRQTRGLAVFWGGKNDFADTKKPAGWKTSRTNTIWFCAAIPTRSKTRGGGARALGNADENPHYYSFYRGALPQKNLDENGDEARDGFSATDFGT